MTIVLRFFWATAPRTSGLALNKVLPTAKPAASRRKSRLLRPSVCASCCAGVMGWRKALLFRNIRTAGFRPSPYPFQPCARHVGVDKSLVLPGRDPSGRCEHNPDPGGNGHRADWDPTAGLARTPELISHSHADRRIDFRVARALQEGSGQVRSIFAAEFRFP